MIVWYALAPLLLLLLVARTGGGGGGGGMEKLRHQHGARTSSSLGHDDDREEAAFEAVRYHHLRQHLAEQQTLDYHALSVQLERSLKRLEDERNGVEAKPISGVAGGGCPNCLYKHAGDDDDHDDDNDDERAQSDTDSLRLEAIKRQILSKLGLRHKPNVTYAFPREIIMETLFRAEDGSPANGGGGGGDGGNGGAGADVTGSGSVESSALDVDDFYGRTSEIITFAEQGVRVNGNRLLEFRVGPESAGRAGQEFRVRAATLWLKADVRHARTAKCKSTEIYVFKFVAGALSRSVKINSKEFSELTEDPVALALDETNPGWQKVDLTRTVRAWLESPDAAKDRLRLFVDCSCCSNWHVHLFNTPETSVDPHRPFLVIHTDPTTAKRVRRRALDCGADAAGNQCCKQRFYVSFKELGWDDWIIAPQGYYANYCRGDCGHHRTPDSYVTYHTHVIEEIRKTHHLSGMQPCCAPLRFSSMSLIYFGPDSNIIKRDLPKMVVDECGCP